MSDMGGDDSNLDDVSGHGGGGSINGGDSYYDIDHSCNGSDRGDIVGSGGGGDNDNAVAITLMMVVVVITMLV